VHCHGTGGKGGRKDGAKTRGKKEGGGPSRPGEYGDGQASMKSTEGGKSGSLKKGLFSVVKKLGQEKRIVQGRRRQGKSVAGRSYELL